MKIVLDLFQYCAQHVGVPKSPPPPARGATDNALSARFNLPAREVDGEWLDTREALGDAPPPLRTSVTVERPRTIITRNNSPDKIGRASCRDRVCQYV